MRQCLTTDFEIDILEGVHDNEHNQVTWHTGPGCNLTPNDNFTGTMVVCLVLYVSYASSIERFGRALLTVMARLPATRGAVSRSGAVHHTAPTLTPRGVASMP